MDRIQRARGVEQVFEEAVDGLMDVLDVDFCALLSRSGSESLRLRAGAGLTPALRRALEGLPPLVTDVADPGPRVAGPDAPFEAAAVADRRRDPGERAPLGSLIRIPLLHRGRGVGEIVAGRDGGSLTRAEIRLAEMLAVHVVFGMWRARSDEWRTELQRRREAERTAARTLIAPLELRETLDAVAESVVGSFADWSVLYRADGDTLRAVAAAHRDSGEETVARSVVEYELGARDRAHPIRHALDSGSPLRVQEPERDPMDVFRSGPPPVRRTAARLGCAAALVLPLRDDEVEPGVLVAVRTRDRFTEDDLALGVELAGWAAVAVANATLFERTRAADRAKADFLAVMSHEFRTPLSAILGYTDILTARVHGELSAKQQAQLDRVKASARHLSFLVDEILSFASMEAGRERVTAASTDLRAVVVDCTTLLESMAEAAGLRMGVTVPDEPLVVETDESKVRQVVINLVSNALKFTAEGSVTVTLEATGDTAYCRVADTGPGIAAEHAERVFEPFWQAHRTERRITGTGLGLAVSRRLARLIGGDLTLESRVGEGSRFTLAIPRTPAPDPAGPGVAGDPPR